VNTEESQETIEGTRVVTEETHENTEETQVHTEETPEPRKEPPVEREEEIRAAIQACQSVLDELGPRFTERVYRRAVEITLHEQGIAAQAGVGIAVWFHGQIIGTFEADLVLPSHVILELKVGDRIDDWHEAQLLNYLRCTCAEIGYVVAFGTALRYKRFILDNSRKRGVRGDGFVWRG